MQVDTENCNFLKTVTLFSHTHIFQDFFQAFKTYYVLYLLMYIMN